MYRRKAQVGHFRVSLFVKEYEGARNIWIEEKTGYLKKIEEKVRKVPVQ